MELKNEVDRASKESDWLKTVSWPAFLKSLHTTYSREYIVSHEKEIKDYLNDYGVYCGDYSFAEHFGKRSKHGSTRGRAHSDTASATSSSHGELSDHSASHSLHAKDAAGRSKSSPGKSDLLTPTNSFTSRVAKQKEIFGMMQVSAATMVHAEIFASAISLTSPSNRGISLLVLGVSAMRDGNLRLSPRAVQSSLGSLSKK
jgi:hypothetical protein